MGREERGGRGRKGGKSGRDGQGDYSKYGNEAEGKERGKQIINVGMYRKQLLSFKPRAATNQNRTETPQKI